MSQANTESYTAAKGRHQRPDSCHGHHAGRKARVNSISPDGSTPPTPRLQRLMPVNIRGSRWHAGGYCPCRDVLVRSQKPFHHRTRHRRGWRHDQIDGVSQRLRMDLQTRNQADLARIGYGVRFLQNSEISQRVAQHCRDAGGGGDLDPGVPVPRSGIGAREEQREERIPVQLARFP